MDRLGVLQRHGGAQPGPSKKRGLPADALKGLGDSWTWTQAVVVDGVESPGCTNILARLDPLTDDPARFWAGDAVKLLGHARLGAEIRLNTRNVAILLPKSEVYGSEHG